MSNRDIVSRKVDTDRAVKREKSKNESVCQKFRPLPLDKLTTSTERGPLKIGLRTVISRDPVLY